MKRFKRVFALLAALAALLSLCACTSPNPERELSRAQEKLRQVKSYRCDMDIDMALSVGGTPVGVKASCAAECLTDPMTLRLDISLNSGTPDGLALDGTVYAAEDAGAYTAYINTGGGWVKQQLDGLAELEQYDIRTGMDTLLSDFSSVTEAGSEDIGGASAVRYDCVVSAQAVDGIMDGSGTYSQLAVLGLTEERAREMLSGLGEMPYSVWLDSKSSLPLRCEVDMSGVMAALVEGMSASGAPLPEMSLDKLVLTAELSGFDGIDAIEIPDAALHSAQADGDAFLFP